MALADFLQARHVGVAEKTHLHTREQPLPGDVASLQDPPMDHFLRRPVLPVRSSVEHVGPRLGLPDHQIQVGSLGHLPQDVAGRVQQVVTALLTHKV
ncbi:MAG: hypothetical protein BWY88_00723 [Synergistetes bacterium ADurb.Bin520]|nr:MAG: hypothetical protein BWY88_00723 [Synergistetes bacterium ADurb.Bin520]